MIGQITVAELQRLVATGLSDPELPGAVVRVFDVRSGEEYLAGHIPGSDQVPHASVIRWIPQQCHTQQLVVLVDADGAPHGPARHVAAELGHKWFRRARALEGGIAAWRTAGGAIEAGGVVGTSAASNDGVKGEFQASGRVPWKSPALADVPHP